MTFSQPSAGGDQFDAKDHNGRLVLVYPKSFSAETPTIHGVGPSADCDIVVVDAVDATGKPLYFENARLFGNLAKSVSRDLGGQVLGRLGQVPTQRGNPAWVLQNFTEQDALLAGNAHAAYQQGQFKQAANPMAQPAAPAPTQQWQQAPAPAPAAPIAAPQQQFPAPAPQQQAWPQQAAPAAPPAYGATTSPAPQQPPAPAAPAATWQAPAAAPVAAAAPPAATAGPAADPALLAHLATVGINLPPTTLHTEALAIYETLPQ